MAGVIHRGVGEGGVVVVSPPPVLVIRDWNAEDVRRGGDSANMAATAGMGGRLEGGKGLRWCNDVGEVVGGVAVLSWMGGDDGGAVAGLRRSATSDMLELLDMEVVDSLRGTASCSTLPCNSCSW